jgi:hypothetical protein
MQYSSGTASRIPVWVLVNYSCQNVTLARGRIECLKRLRSKSCRILKIRLSWELEFLEVDFVQDFADVSYAYIDVDHCIAINLL